MSAGTWKLGGDLEIKRLGYGAMRLTGEGVWGPPKDVENAKAVLRRVVELGVNFIDTSDAYGPAVNEPMIGETLSPYKPGLVIATKAGLTRTGPMQWHPVGRPEYITQEVEMSLRYLKLERLDLWQLHRIDPKVPVEETLGAAKKLQEQGKIRHIGLSEVSVDEIKQARKVVDIVSVQNEYNLTQRKSEAVLDYCTAENIAFIPWFPVGGGKVFEPGGKLDTFAKQHNITISQLCIAWLLHRSPVMLPIPGTSSIAHLEENVKSADVNLTEAEWKEVEAAAKG